MTNYKDIGATIQRDGEAPVPGDPEFYQQLQLPSFTKKVEILRALELTVSQFDKEFGGIRSLPFCVGGNIKDIDLKLMEEFKKVYSLGTNQLESFISELDDVGEDLDEYSILYYISLLKNGPYEQPTRQITGEAGGINNITVDIFKPGPDIMGVNGNWAATNTSVPVFGGIAQDVPNDTLRKAPGVIISLLARGKQNANGVFNAAVSRSGAIYENTLPYIDKKNTERVQEEMADGRNKVNPVHGNLMVKDIEKIEIHKNAEEGIIEQINNYLGDAAFRLFLFRKLINFFNKDQNLAQSTGAAINRKVDYMSQEFEEPKEEDEECSPGTPEILKKKTEDVETDMFGRTFDSVERREFELKTKGANGENLFKLYTIKGQLGSGIDVKPEPMDED